MLTSSSESSSPSDDSDSDYNADTDLSQKRSKNGIKENKSVKIKQATKMCKPNHTYKKTAAKTVSAVTSDNKKITKTQPTKKIVADQSDRCEELSKLQTSLLTIEKRIIAMDEETSLQKEITNSELLCQKKCLELILDEDKQKRTSTSSATKTNPLHIKVTSLEEKLANFSEAIQAQSNNITKLLQAQQKKSVRSEVSLINFIKVSCNSTPSSQQKSAD